MLYYMLALLKAKEIMLCILHNRIYYAFYTIVQIVVKLFIFPKKTIHNLEGLKLISITIPLFIAQKIKAQCIIDPQIYLNYNSMKSTVVQYIKLFFYYEKFVFNTIFTFLKLFLENSINTNNA